MLAQRVCERAPRERRARHYRESEQWMSERSGLWEPHLCHRRFRIELVDPVVDGVVFHAEGYFVHLVVGHVIGDLHWHCLCFVQSLLAEAACGSLHWSLLLWEIDDSEKLSFLIVRSMHMDVSISLK